MNFQPTHNPTQLVDILSEWISKLSLPVRLIAGLAGLILMGTALLLLPGMATRPLTFTEAIFTATSALTVTGLSVIVPGTDLTFAGQVVLLALIQVGGIGLVIFTVVIFRMLGRRISVVDRMALRGMFGNVLPGGVIRLTMYVVIGVLIIEAVGALLLWTLWTPKLGSAQALWFAIFHSVSAFCNSGFDLFAGVPGYTTIPNDSGTLAVLGTLIFIGSLGVPVLADLVAARRKEHHLTLHTRLTLIFVIVLMALSTTTIFIADGVQGGVMAEEPVNRQIGLALFQSVSARTAGYAGMPDFDEIAAPSRLMLIIVMFVGAAPASMGGGITTGTAIALTLALWSYARNRPYPEVGGRTISTATIRRATAVLTISIAVVLTATILISLSNPYKVAEEVLFEVVSAFATCGLTLLHTPALNTAGRYVIILVMIWGRLGALTIIMALARPVKQSLYVFPEEQIMIG
ncbi:MAG TPA: potassium transporter TrkG [Levilinea sp.]|nr:potassium transporter TrkG [Levilinea sp.]